MAEQPAVNMIVNPNDQLLRYMENSNGFLEHFARQLDTNDLISGIHVFSGSCAKSFREWMRDLDRIYIDHMGEHEFMRKIVTRTVQDLAADFLVELKRNADAPLPWDQIRTSFYERFSNYVDAQIAQHKLKSLKQERKQGLHSFAQRIQDTAREAYSEAELRNPIVVRELKNIFIDGLRDHHISRMLIKEDVDDLYGALNRAIRDDLLNQTYRLRHLNTDSTDNRQITDMDVDAIQVDDKLANNAKHVSEEMWCEMADSIAAIAAVVRPHRPNAQNTAYAHRPNAHNAAYAHRPNAHNNTYVRRTLHNASSNQQTDKRQFYQGQQHNNNNNNNTSSNNVSNTGSYRSSWNNNSNNVPHRNNYRWADNGDPYCSHCSKRGHYRRQCWTLYPNLRPNNGPKSEATNVLN